MNSFPEDDLREILERRATLYSGSRVVRADLVTRTMLAAAEIDVGFNTDIEDDLFLLMHRIAEEDEQACAVA